MSVGKVFESYFKKSIDNNKVYYYRLKDDTSGFKAIKNPCDYFLFYNKTLYFMELKTTKGKSISFMNISDYQISEMLRAAGTYESIKAGVVINFREHKKTFYIDIDTLKHFIDTSSKKSISIEDLEKIGYRLKQKELRVHCTFDIMDLLEHI